MTRKLILVLSVLSVLAIALGVGAALAVGPAAADDHTATPETTPTEAPPESQTDTATPAATETTTPEPTTTTAPTGTSTPTTSSPSSPPSTAPTETPDEEDDEPETFLIEIGDHGSAFVLSQAWDESDGTVTIELLLEESQTIVVTDASIDLQEQEARAIGQNQRRLPPGRATVTFRVEQPNDAAVTVGSSAGGLISLSPGNAGWFDRNSQWADVRAAAAGAGSFGIVAMLGGGWYAIAKRRVTGVEIVDMEETHD